MYAKAPQSVEAMCDYFTPHTEMRIIVYLRPQHEWVEAAYGQLVRHGRGRSMPLSKYMHLLDVKHFCEMVLQSRYVRYSQLVNDLIDVAGSNTLIIKPYSKGLDISRSFFATAGIESGRGGQSSFRENLSLTALQVEILASLRRLTKISDAERALMLFEYMKRERLTKFDGDGFSVIPDEYFVRLLEVADADWRQLMQLPQSVTERSEVKSFDEIRCDFMTTKSRTFTGDLISKPMREEWSALLALALDNPPMKSRRWSSAASFSSIGRRVAGGRISRLLQILREFRLR